MWPRDGVATKLNGFVCFVYRADAENALEACQDMDPFGTGHRLTLSWGKKMLTAAPDSNNNDDDGDNDNNNNNHNHTAPPPPKREYYDSDQEDEVAWHRPGCSESRRGKLTSDEQNQFDHLFRTHLSASRDAICRAMAFCFEKSSAAAHICTLWQSILWHVAPADSVDTLIARLYLLSDVLFNSQQPGIRHAFLYRNFVQDVGPTALRIMGAHARATFGRLKQDKLTLAVKAVLGAWATWGVYDAAFLYEVRCAYEGKEPEAAKSISSTGAGAENPSRHKSDETVKIKPLDDTSSSTGDEYMRETAAEKSGDLIQTQFVETDDIDGEPLEEGDLEGVSWSVQDAGSVAAVDDDIDGEEMDDDVVLLEE
jgi:hypothetical protein